MVYLQAKNPMDKVYVEGIAMEYVGLFYGHLVYCTAIWYVVWAFCQFSGNLVYFPPFWYVLPIKSGNPAEACLRLASFEPTNFKYV
jgi:hypothetical protein